nr:hypothetical protein CFP56_73900 [Quercus suber]
MTRYDANPFLLSLFPYPTFKLAAKLTPDCSLLDSSERHVIQRADIRARAALESRLGSRGAVPVWSDVHCADFGGVAHNGDGVKSEDHFLFPVGAYGQPTTSSLGVGSVSLNVEGI